MIKLKQQLAFCDQSRSIFNSFRFHIKDIFIYIIFLMLITVIFNRNYFNHLDIYTLNYITFIFF